MDGIRRSSQDLSSSSFQNSPAQGKMVMLSLFCVIVGKAGSAFEVKIDNGESVVAFKDAIKTKNGDDATLKNVDAKKLQLFLAKSDGRWLPDNEDLDTLLQCQIDTSSYLSMRASWKLNKPELFGSGDSLGEGVVHVLVVAPKGAGIDVALPNWTSSHISDGTDLWLSRFHQNEVANISLLPTLGDLNEYIKRPLPVKIGLPQSVLQAWSSPLVLGQVLREKLFEVNEVSPCVFLEELVFSCGFLYPQVNGDATESAFISFWDSIIRAVLGFVFRRAYANRDSSRESSSDLKRPDFLFCLDQICVFRGEENEPRISITVPRKELFKNMVWSYGGLPYVFGYAASGFELELFALYHDGVGKRKNSVRPHFIGGFNLQETSERFRFVLALLKLCLLFPAIVRNCPASAKTEFMDIRRDNGMVRLSPTFVDKSFHTVEEYRRVKLIYDSLKPFGLPHADTVVTANSNQLMLIPRGIEMKPCSLSELFVALRNVLKALVVLHRNGWMHRDIRWSNVIKQIDRVEWFLIDFADAAQNPQKYPSGDHLTDDEHAPEIFVQGGSHTTAVGVWAVGYLVQTSKFEREWSAEPERALFLDRLVNTDPNARPTADEALQLVSRFEREAAEQESQEGVRKKQRCV